MQNLEIHLINLFMIGEIFSKTPNNGVIKDTTEIKCDNFIFEFKQLDIQLKQSECVNKTILTTVVTIHDITKDQIPLILDIIDDICWLLSLAQQSSVIRHSYKINNLEIESKNCTGFIINSPAYIIENRGKSIRNFLCTRQISQNPYPIRILPS